MRPGELLQAVERYMADPDLTSLPVLVQGIHNLADMVGWAAGPIDPEGSFTKRLVYLLGVLQDRHKAAPDGGIAILHDALGQLADEIARHDGDLDARRAGQDEGEDFI